MIEPRFKLGDTVYSVRYDRTEKTIICPDCLGSARVKVTLGTGEEIMIECGGCDPGGYKGSTGRIRQYDYAGRITAHTVTGINLQGDDVEYQLDRFGGSSYSTGTERGNYPVFATEEEAKVCGEELKQKHEDEENKRLLAKTQDHKTWSWNATYHRSNIKRLEREIDYHRSKVEICKSHVKEEKDGTNH
uniref:Uncharacterized protein n=1 Tax=viral metagenome TaxID=1070528 RepID=A0A6M3JKE1_9ZZZZ